MVKTDGALAVIGATLIDLRTGACTPNAAVLVREERIAQVGTVEMVSIPSGTQVIDASGEWVIPGLADMHVHLGVSPLHPTLLPLYLAHGVTTIRDVGGNLTELLLMREEIRTGRKTGPRLFMAGPILDGFPPLWPATTTLVDTPRRAESAVRFLVEQGVDLIKVYNSVPETSLEVIVGTAHAMGLRVAGHVPRAITMTRAVEIGMDCLEHIRITGRELLPLDEANQIDFLPLATRETLLWDRFELEAPRLGRLIEFLAGRQVFLDPTLLVDWATFAGEAEAQHADPINEILPQEVREALDHEDNSPVFRVPDELEERARRGFAKRLRFIAMCNRAGVRLLAGTDTFGLGKQLPGVGLQNELALLVEAGLTPLEALQAATVTAAAALDQEANLGVVEAGKAADLVVLSADPLADIRHTRDVRLVIKGGQVYQRTELLEMVKGAPVGVA
jgi:imidazolonepropionase-like amidohydrolase